MADGGEVGGEEKLLAGLAHVALFAGAFIIAPVAIYFWKRRESLFVAFHAVQAAIVAFVSIALGGVVMMVALPAAAVAAVAFGERSPVAMVTAIVLLYGLVFLVVMLPFAIALVAGWRAFNGDRWSIPIVGRLAERIVRADPQAGAGGSS